MDNYNPTPWRIADDDKTKIVDAAGELVTFVTNDFSSYNALADNAALIVRAVNASESSRKYDEALVRDVIDHGLLDPCDADAALALLREHPEWRAGAVYLARIAASLERVAEQMPAAPNPAREEEAEEG